MSGTAKAVMASVVLVLALTWGGASTAAVWDNLAYDAVHHVESNHGNADWKSEIYNRDGSGSGRWTNDNFGVLPYFTFILMQETSIGYLRWYSITDNQGGSGSNYSYYLEYHNEADGWQTLDGSAQTVHTTSGGQWILDTPILADQIRWVFTDVSGGLRFNKFEFYAENPHNYNLVRMSGATVTWKAADGTKEPIDLIADRRVTGDWPAGIDAPGEYPEQKMFGPDHEGKQQYVELLLPTPANIELLRVTAESPGQSIGMFSIEYLDANGDWVTATGPDGTLYGDLVDQFNISVYDLDIPATMGLRLNITSPSTNGHNILRLMEFSAFGTAVPEPAIWPCWLWAVWRCCVGDDRPNNLRNSNMQSPNGDAMCQTT